MPVAQKRHYFLHIRLDTDNLLDNTPYSNAKTFRHIYDTIMEMKNTHCSPLLASGDLRIISLMVQTTLSQDMLKGMLEDFSLYEQHRKGHGKGKRFVFRAGDKAVLVEMKLPYAQYNLEDEHRFWLNLRELGH